MNPDASYPRARLSHRAPTTALDVTKWSVVRTRPTSTPSEMPPPKPWPNPTENGSDQDRPESEDFPMDRYPNSHRKPRPALLAPHPPNRDTHETVSG